MLRTAVLTRAYPAEVFTMRGMSVVAVGCLTWAALVACGGSTDAGAADAAARVKGGFESLAAPGQAMSTQTAATGAARDEAAKALGVPPEQVRVETVESVQWRDASLGCAEPGKTFAQVLTPGLRIVVSSAGQRHEVHVDGDGRAVVCQNPTQ
jgi:hypothetical protein